MFNEESKNQLALYLMPDKNAVKKVVEDEIKICQERKRVLKDKELEQVMMVKRLIERFTKKMSDLTNVSKLKQQEIEDDMADYEKCWRYGVMVGKVWLTMQRSVLFCNDYLPNDFEDQNYKALGFDWPSKDELIMLCIKHEIEPKDLILDRIHWKKDGCGF